MKPTPRFRWKLLIALAAVLIVGVVVSWGGVGKALERKPFAGRIDPASGVRCRFTLSSNWHGGDTGLSGSATWLDNASFTPLPPSPIVRWIDSHLRPQSSSASPKIYLYSLPARNSAEYPDVKNALHVLSHRHLRVDGYPATVLCHDEMQLSGKHNRITSLIVHTPRCSFDIVGMTEGADSDTIDREMQAIIASFHIEKVGAAPPDSNRWGSEGAADQE